jgi:predicted nucleotidyltransferase
MIKAIQGPEELIRKVSHIIRKYVSKETQVFLFGSRADGTAWERSDFDFGILDDKPISIVELSKIKQEVEMLPTLFKIDIVDFYSVSDEMKRVGLETKRLL